MIPAQYGEIFKYDGIIQIKDGIDLPEINKENEKVAKLNNINETLEIYMKSVKITNIDNDQDINLIVPTDKTKLADFISLQSRQTKKSYTLDDDSIILSEKIASSLGIKKGDIITIKNIDDIEKEVKVGAITENYLLHYIYMSQNLFNNLYGENSFKPNSILFKVNEELNNNDEKKIGKEILSDESIVSGIIFLSTTKTMFNDVMEKMSLVVYVLIVAAGLLAFAVLYNLSNVNISERIRELATIKVLGFYDKEVFHYVIKETRILTIIGIVLGFFGGYFLMMYVLQTCELDILMFDKRIHNISYLYGAIITIIFAEIVNLAVNHALKKINMIESLKSVE